MSGHNPGEAKFAKQTSNSSEEALVLIRDLIGGFELNNQILKRDLKFSSPIRSSLVNEVAHKNKLLNLKLKLSELHPAELAVVLEGLPLKERELVWHNLQTRQQSEVLMELSQPVRSSLIEMSTYEELLYATQNLGLDDLAFVADDLPSNILNKVREGLTVQEREQFRVAMLYPPDSIGSHMDFETTTIRDDISLEVVHRFLRRLEKLPPHTNKIFVIDRNNLLIGSLSIESLLIRNPTEIVKNVMDKEIISFGVDEKIENLTKSFERYDLISAPVVDNSGRLIGRIIASEIVDIIREENDSEVFASVGLFNQEDIFASVFSAIKNRWIWLAINLMTAFLASRMIGVFEATIQQVVALAALTPIIAGIAGNSGNQTLTLIVRSIALGIIKNNSIPRLLIKEVSIAFINGSVWGFVAGLATWIIYFGNAYAIKLGILMMISIVLNLMLGALIAVIVPFFLRSLRRDPALGSSVLLTFGTDSMGFLIFLGLSTLVFT